MESRLTWQGVEIDGPTALALLEWQREMGADEAMLDAALDRTDLPAPAAVAAAPPAPAAPAAGVSAAAQAAPPVGAQQSLLGDDHAEALAQAEALAAGAATLDALAAAQQGFDGIELKRGARNFVFADGRAAARVMILGEAPGEEEDARGLPFVGRAGQLLDQMFAAIGMGRADPDATRALYVTNVIKWRPTGNRRPTAEEIALSLPFLRRQVELADPEFLVLMGNTPCAAALGREGILRLRGNWTTAFDRPALPMTHPAYLLRNPVAKRESWADLLSLAAKLGL
ncbi:uracil-DNA glycosylase [Paracoccus jeotgali]|uniref:Type-4 uracil-DNA glycosylase n=1 Tax=Paracoccus jeotgali TaxID=2065379 RepID=A0A2K9MBW4_9RHOB|nr:uracil-DNA glycosylase [Paracoccus jeotgali]AUM73139.1 uracil-DNA glycosylase [Paracoccus jeotgali]